MKNINLFLTVVSAFFISTACQTTGTKGDSGHSGQSADANLTEQEAAERYQSVADIRYTLSMQLDAKKDTFDAQARVDFDVKGDGRHVFLDFKDGATIEKFAINGKDVSPRYAAHRIQLTDLQPGAHNFVQISYHRPYSHEGRGLHQFKDPEDGLVYLYSQFEDYDAHQMFPCFDQPDLKATMSLTVTAPKSWQVISTTMETGKKTGGDFTTWTFAKTPRISSYLFSLHAGPYYKWTGSAGSIPYRLFARQSFKQFVVVKDWIVPTQQGLKFYGQYFNYPYPFKKYDEIIVPEFNAGAMENVAAITFSERYVHRGPSTRHDRQELAEVILHEMAHMWFGDLVTMKWWNGAWLNESFATYMSYLAGTSATEYKDMWVDFQSWAKSRAYLQDQLVTTHPIDGVVPDTNSSFANFDGITYGKGASVLKQLDYYLGSHSFRDGIRYYFKKHAYQNTTLEDFIGALEHSSKKELGSWATTWLKTAGLDSVQTEFQCSKGKVSRIELRLSGPDGHTSPRVHSALVALYYKKGDTLAP